MNTKHNVSTGKYKENLTKRYTEPNLDRGWTPALNTVLKHSVELGLTPSMYKFYLAVKTIKPGTIVTDEEIFKQAQINEKACQRARRKLDDLEDADGCKLVTIKRINDPTFGNRNKGTEYDFSRLEDYALELDNHHRTTRDKIDKYDVQMNSTGQIEPQIRTTGQNVPTATGQGVRHSGYYQDLDYPLDNPGKDLEKLVKDNNTGQDAADAAGAAASSETAGEDGITSAVGMNTSGDQEYPDPDLDTEGALNEAGEAIQPTAWGEDAPTTYLFRSSPLSPKKYTTEEIFELLEIDDECFLNEVKECNPVWEVNLKSEDILVLFRGNVDTMKLIDRLNKERNTGYFVGWYEVVDDDDHIDVKEKTTTEELHGQSLNDVLNSGERIDPAILEILKDNYQGHEVEFEL